MSALRLFLVSTFCCLIAGNGSLANEIRLVGEPEVYLPRAAMNCSAVLGIRALDVPDIPVTAFRRKDGSVVVLAGNQQNFFLEGQSVDTARRASCDNLIPSRPDPDPEDFDARRWLFAIYAKSYDLVLGFVHNEYHGSDFFPDECRRTSRQNFECWYGSTTLVTSVDGGFTFTAPPVQDKVVASPPVKFQTGKLRMGTATPKVVGNPNDSFVYVMINYFDANRKSRIGQCLLRGTGSELNDWKAWDGNQFALDMESPYILERGPDCRIVLPYLISSVKYIPSIGKFVALGIRQNKVIYAFSSDLVTWSKPQELTEFVQIQKWKTGDDPARSYFSLLDSDSSSINFDTLESRPYLYFVQFGTGPDFLRQRDVYRQRIEIR